MAAAKRSTVMAAVKRSTVVVLLLAAASAEPLKSLGDTLTDEAIGLAGQGRMQEALERFFDAREAEPQDSRRWQNVGVTLMRMGHLEDARASLEEAIRLAPGDATCVANLEALSQHEAHRDRERGQYYARLWQQALAAQPHAISITSYNEWGEGLCRK